MEQKIIMTDDGSNTIFIPELNECYHSKNGAFAESNHIFISAGYRFAAENKETMNILEVGFGTGLNALLTLIEANNHSQAVYYLGLEPYRVDKKKLDSLNYPALTGVPEANYFFEEIHQTSLAKQITDHFTLSISEEKIEDIVLQKSYFDLVYFDAFAPAVCPELWAPAIFQKIYESMKSGGILVTYSCKGDVKRALKSAGFIIEKLPGPAREERVFKSKKKLGTHRISLVFLSALSVLVFFFPLASLRLCEKKIIC